MLGIVKIVMNAYEDGGERGRKGRNGTGSRSLRGCTGRSSGRGGGEGGGGQEWVLLPGEAPKWGRGGRKHTSIIDIIVGGLQRWNPETILNEPTAQRADVSWQKHVQCGEREGEEIMFGGSARPDTQSDILRCHLQEVMKQVGGRGSGEREEQRRKGVFVGEGGDSAGSGG